MDEDYDNVFWPQLREALDVLLLNTPFPTTSINTGVTTVGATCQRISFEQMYSAVYKCVCKQYSERLYQDLLSHVGQIIQRQVDISVAIGEGVT